MVKGLVMEGGAMRGMFTCGVVDVFLENGITFDKAVGVSAGAAFGCNYKSRQHGRPLRYNTTYCGDKRYASIRSWITTGDLYNADFCYRELPWELDPWDADAFAADPMEFYCVATDVATGRPVYYKCKDGREKDIQWIRASASMPLASVPVQIGEREFLDGGISDSIPLRFMERRGCDRIVVVETQPADYRKKKQKALPLIRASLHRYPNMIRAIETRYRRYNAQKQYVQLREDTGSILVIRPYESLHIGSREKDPAELERVYLIGRACALEKLEEIRRYLS